MDKEDVVDIQNRILLSHKKGNDMATRKKLDSQNHLDKD